MLYISPLFPFILIGIDFFEYKFRHRRASESSSILFFSFLSRVRISWFFCVCVMEARRTNTLWRPTLSDTHQTHFFILFSALCWAVVWCVCVMSLVVVVVFVFFIIFTSLRVMLGLDHRLHFPPIATTHYIECRGGRMSRRSRRSRRWVREKCQSLFLVSFLISATHTTTTTTKPASQSEREI
jgi:hypothetical protein